MSLARLATQLQAHQQASLMRERYCVAASDAVYIQLDGQRLLNFTSNDYLGFRHDPAMMRALAEAASTHGIGAGASMLVSGYTDAHQALEQALATLTGRERAVVFASGFMANLGVITALSQTHAPIFADKAVHASIIDAMKLSGQRFVRYRHHDVSHLASLLTPHHGSAPLVVSDSVCSVDGSIAPVAELAALAAGGLLVIDDAHGLGVLGAHGGGIVEHAGLDEVALPVLICPFGKALGGMGAGVAGPAILIDTLIQFARPLMYSTALSPALAGALTVAIERLPAADQQRQQLQSNIETFHECAALQGLAVLPSSTALQAVLMGTAERALACQTALRQQGYWVAVFRAPTVPAGTARLRINLSASHEPAMIAGLVRAITRFTHD